MKKPVPSSIRTELAWLGLYLTIFAVGVYLMLKFVAPHHFNDRVGIMIVAILAAAGTIGLRARTSRRIGP